MLPLFAEGKARECIIVISFTNVINVNEIIDEEILEICENCLDNLRIRYMHHTSII